MRKNLRYRKVSIILFIVAIVLMIATGSVYAEPKVSGSLIKIISDNGKPISRAEFLIRGLHFSSDIYLMGEHRGDADLYKARIQLDPLEIIKIVSLGIAVQHVDGTAFAAHQEIGSLVRVKGNIAEGLFAKADIRYWPETDVADMYVFLNSKKFFSELYAVYNTETRNLMLRPVVDFKVLKHIFVGIEVKLAGEVSKLDLSYMGPRIRLAF